MAVEEINKAIEILEFKIDELEDENKELKNKIKEYEELHEQEDKTDNMTILQIIKEVTQKTGGEK